MFVVRSMVFSLDEKKTLSTISTIRLLEKVQAVFAHYQELELVNYLKTMEALLFGLTMKDLSTLALQLAV